MSEHVAISFQDVGKMYKIFSSRRASLADALGALRWLPARTERYREFWALRDISFELRQGERLGVIGRNGAGKSTLLKLITGNLMPTEGRVSVVGNVQALLEIGGGLHPEFTGHENIHAALVHLGLSPAEIAAAEDDIAEFTELGSFLDQPFKTYSLGMQARLSFAIGTTVRPEILIIDEILGAGDAYFFGKSSARMQELIEGGAAVLLVSHGLDQIVRFCESAIWLDRGRIVARGPSAEIVKAYEKFIRELEDRRLQAKNRKARSKRFDAFERETYTDSITAAVRPGTATGSSVDVDFVRLLRDGVEEDAVAIGDAQDAASNQSAVVVIEGGAWSGPKREGDVLFRQLDRRTAGDVFGNISFFLWFFYGASKYELEFRYRSTGAAPTLVLYRGAKVVGTAQLPPSSEWTTTCVPLDAEAAVTEDEELDDEPLTGSGVSRWPGEGTFVVDDVRLLDAHDVEQAVFHTGTALRIEVKISARRAGQFPLTLAALIFRVDSVVATRHVAEPIDLDVSEGDAFVGELRLDPLILGNGTYLVSVGLYRTLDVNNSLTSEFYDYLDRSYEFQIVGNPPLHNELVLHPGGWAVVRDDVRRPLASSIETPVAASK